MIQAAATIIVGLFVFYVVMMLVGLLIEIFWNE